MNSETGEVWEEVVDVIDGSIQPLGVPEENLI
jgi:hypothetical protein